MKIVIPKDAASLARSQADAAGFASVDEYVASLIRDRDNPSEFRRKEALEALRDLRGRTPKMTRQEIVALVSEGREQLK